MAAKPKEQKFARRGLVADEPHDQTAPPRVESSGVGHSLLDTQLPDARSRSEQCAGDHLHLDTHRSSVSGASDNGEYGQRSRDTQPQAAALPKNNGPSGHWEYDTQNAYARRPAEQGDEGQPRSDHQTCHALVATIKAAHRKREWAMDARKVIDQQLLSYVRMIMGICRPAQTKKEWNAIKAASTKFIKDVFHNLAKREKAMAKGREPKNLKPIPDDMAEILEQTMPQILASYETRKLYAAPEATAKKALDEAVAALPIWPWAKRIRGVAETSLGGVLAVTGDLSAYKSPAKVWKRLGLAPTTCYDMITKRGVKGNTKPKKRRSVAYRLGDCLIKGNFEGKKPNRIPLGFRWLYDDRKAAHEAAGWGKSQMHRHRDAQRYMEKRLIKHLWREWRRVHGDISAQSNL